MFVVAYDQGASGGAARLWWLLRHFGHEDVAVLDGGIGAWIGPLARGRRGDRAERVRPGGCATDDTIEADELAARLGEPGLVVVDARAPERYRGEAEPIDPVAGRIPGAVNLPSTGIAEIPEEILEADEIVVYCGSGITASADLLALAARGPPGREALSRLVERLDRPRPPGRARLVSPSSRVR